MSTTWLQLEKIEWSSKEMSADNIISLKNTSDWVQPRYLIIRLTNYSITISLIYKYKIKEKFRGFRVQSQAEILVVRYWKKSNKEIRKTLP